MSVGHSAVGCVLGVEFDAKERPWVADTSPAPFIGYWNLNFYVDDIVDACGRVSAGGYRFWSRPIKHAVSGGGGAPTEAIFLGPDNVAINLVELDGSPGSQTAELARESAELPRSRTGFSQVATTAHATHDLATASTFYREVLGMQTVIDTILENPKVNELTGRPHDARTHVIWMRGNHPYGKVALSVALNYTLADRAARAVAPAIGYLAQSFAVPDLAAALVSVARYGVEPLGAPAEVDLAGDRRVTAVMLRAPGSGALIQLTQD
jgi:catechol 2,3-dioxygenase-like lactoylglutathione lyase family enzyme